PGPVFHTIVSIKNDGHYFCRAGGNRPDGLNEPVTNHLTPLQVIRHERIIFLQCKFLQNMNNIFMAHTELP
ncbi:hypothetical protein ODR34_24600, partial [Escherichia coli]|nr:hypothetical protein [Escherichia coli]